LSSRTAAGAHPGVPVWFSAAFNGASLVQAGSERKANLAAQTRRE